MTIRLASPIRPDSGSILAAQRIAAALAHRFDCFRFHPGVTPEELARLKASLAEIRKLRAQVTANPLQVQYFSAAPFLFGQDRIMKFSVKPVGALKVQKLSDAPSPNYLRDALKATLDEGKDVHLHFMVQVRDRAPEAELENATTVWKESEHPFATVAEITIPAPQPDAHSSKGEAACEQLVFNPWHSLPEHQPVGSINRLRRAVYVASAKHRDAGQPRGPEVARDQVRP